MLTSYSRLPTLDSTHRISACTFESCADHFTILATCRCSTHCTRKPTPVFASSLSSMAGPGARSCPRFRCVCSFYPSVQNFRCCNWHQRFCTNVPTLPCSHDRRHLLLPSPSNRPSAIPSPPPHSPPSTSSSTLPPPQPPNPVCTPSARSSKSTLLARDRGGVS